MKEFGTKVEHKISGIDGRLCGRRQFEHKKPEICIERYGVNDSGQLWPVEWFYECECSEVAK